MMTSLLPPFFLFSCIGLVLCLIAHIAALLGLPEPFPKAAPALRIGLIVVWIPAAFAAHQLGPSLQWNDPARRKVHWGLVLRGCPTWMRWLTYGFIGYAFFNFFLFFIRTFEQGLAGQAQAGAGIDFLSLALGHWMAFYAVAAAVLYSAMAVANSDTENEKANGETPQPSTNSDEPYSSLEQH